jgi:hypothetical protein
MVVDDSIPPSVPLHPTTSCLRGHDPCILILAPSSPPPPPPPRPCSKKLATAKIDEAALQRRVEAAEAAAAAVRAENDKVAQQLREAREALRTAGGGQAGGADAGKQVRAAGRWVLGGVERSHGWRQAADRGWLSP